MLRFLKSRPNNVRSIEPVEISIALFLSCAIRMEQLLYPLPSAVSESAMRGNHFERPPCYPDSMTTLLLIRHAEAAGDAGIVLGRASGSHLSAAGHKQAERLASCLAEAPITAVYSSPIDRAVETAAYISRQIGSPCRIAEGLNELDYGLWTGRSYRELSEDRQWLDFNNCRSCTRIPAGESIVEVIARASAEIERLQRAHPCEIVAAVSHADVIRAVLAHFLGIPMDLALRIEVNLASVSILRFFDRDLRVLLINGTGDEPIERA
jgi:probable phosphoglycerate mutase